MTCSSVQNVPFPALRALCGLRWVAVMGLFAIVSCGEGIRAWADNPRPTTALATLQSRHAQLQSTYRAALMELLQFCTERNLSTGTTEISRYLQPIDANRISMVSLPRSTEPEIATDLTPDERQWRTQLRFQRKEYSRKLYLLSRQALQANCPAFAYDLIREIVQHDPDHAKARELLGYVQFRNEWVTPFARKMLLKGEVWSEQFGWLPKNSEDRYARGERYVTGSGWMSKEKEAEIRRDFGQAWVIDTDHYHIRTNYSQERAVELGKALEDFHEFFHQVFAGFFNDPEQLEKIFDGSSRTVNLSGKQYLVNYYRSRDEYVGRLKKSFPQIEVTNGIYLTGGRTAHFYFDPEGDHEATLFHEGTHQLFFESSPQNRKIGEDAHFWILEGIACYMESFRRLDGEFSVGDPGYIRFAGARMNYIDKQYYIPLRQFSTLGMQEFQSAPMLARNYTQAAGLAHFFMHYDGGRYRDALVAHLSDLYSSNARKREGAEGLDSLTGVSYDDLDRQYGEWMQALRAAEREHAVLAE